MGADYLEASIIITTPGQVATWMTSNTHPSEADLQVILRDALPKETYPVDDDLGMYLEGRWDTDPLLALPDAHDDTISADTMAAIAARIISDFLDTVGGRDCTETTLTATHTRITTGGMSWGDAPTDAFQTIIDMTALPPVLQDACGVTFTDPREDALTQLAALNWGDLTADRDVLARLSADATVTDADRVALTRLHTALETITTIGAVLWTDTLATG